MAGWAEPHDCRDRLRRCRLRMALRIGIELAVAAVAAVALIAAVCGRLLGGCQPERQYKPAGSASTQPAIAPVSERGLFECAEPAGPAGTHGIGAAPPCGAPTPPPAGTFSSARYHPGPRATSAGRSARAAGPRAVATAALSLHSHGQGPAADGSAVGPTVHRFRVTAYCPCPRCCGAWSDGVTAGGHRIATGDRFVAAPAGIPFGTVIDVPGYGRVPVLDRGGAIKAGRLDVYFDTHAEALAWGVRNLDCIVETN